MDIEKDPRIKKIEYSIKEFSYMGYILLLISSIIIIYVVIYFGWEIPIYLGIFLMMIAAGMIVWGAHLKNEKRHLEEDLRKGKKPVEKKENWSNLLVLSTGIMMIITGIFMNVIPIENKANPSDHWDYEIDHSEKYVQSIRVTGLIIGLLIGLPLTIVGSYWTRQTYRHNKKLILTRTEEEF